MALMEFPEIRQVYNYNCGSCAMQAVLSYYGIDVNESKVIKAAGTSSKRGTLPTGMARAAKKFGLKCKAGSMTLIELMENIDAKKPTIVLLQAYAEKKNPDWAKTWKSGHYAIAIGYDWRRVYFEDPASASRTYLQFGELEARWHYMDPAGKKYLNYGITLYGKKPCFRRRNAVHMD